MELNEKNRQRQRWPQVLRLRCASLRMTWFQGWEGENRRQQRLQEEQRRIQTQKQQQRRIPIRLRSEGVTFLSLLGKVVGTARKIRGFFASLRMTNKKVTASQNDKQKSNSLSG